MKKRKVTFCLNEFVSLAVSHTMPIVPYYCSAFGMAFYMQYDFMAKKKNVLRTEKWNKNKTRCCVQWISCIFPSNRSSICYHIIPYSNHYPWTVMLFRFLVKSTQVALVEGVHPRWDMANLHSTIKPLNCKIFNINFEI